MHLPIVRETNADRNSTTAHKQIENKRQLETFATSGISSRNQEDKSITSLNDCPGRKTMIRKIFAYPKTSQIALLALSALMYITSLCMAALSGSIGFNWAGLSLTLIGAVLLSLIVSDINDIRRHRKTQTSDPTSANNPTD